MAEAVVGSNLPTIMSGVWITDGIQPGPVCLGLVSRDAEEETIFGRVRVTGWLT